MPRSDWMSILRVRPVLAFAACLAADLPRKETQALDPGSPGTDAMSSGEYESHRAFQFLRLYRQRELDPILG